MPKVTLLLDSAAIAGALKQIAAEILNQHAGGAFSLVGIQKGGVVLAERLALLLRQADQAPVIVGHLDVSMHRDDLNHRAAPEIHPTLIPGDINGKTIILVDDVLFKGRTTRAALDALNDFGRPQCIQLAVLVDRGHRELPIHPNFVGKTIQTSVNDTVDVRLTESNREEGVYLITP